MICCVPEVFSLEKKIPKTDFNIIPIKHITITRTKTIQPPANNPVIKAFIPVMSAFIDDIVPFTIAFTFFTLLVASSFPLCNVIFAILLLIQDYYSCVYGIESNPPHTYFSFD